MVLTVNNEVLGPGISDSHSLYMRYPKLKEGALQLTAIPPKVIGPAGLLYVGQREFAITMPQDKTITILGSDDSTTCIIVILRHSGSGVTGMAHADRAGLEDGTGTMAERVQQQSAGHPIGQLELCLIGGFADPRGCSEELFSAVLASFHQHLLNIELVKVCVGELNSTTRGGINWPIIYGVGMNVKTGDIFPATFPDKGPDLPLRNARHFTGCREMLDIYDSSLSLLRIGPFSYEPLRGVSLWLQQRDEFILSHLSTSPEVEPPHFVIHVRAALKHIQDHPFPAVTVFPDNRPRYYRKDEGGAWLPVAF